MGSGKATFGEELLLTTRPIELVAAFAANQNFGAFIVDEAFHV